MRLRTTIPLAFLLFSVMVGSVAVPPAHGIAGGAPRLGTVNAVPSGGTFTGASYSMAIAGNGTIHVTAVDGSPVSPATHLFAIDFAGVIFSGATFRLSVSTDGLSAESPGDLAYSPTFFVSDFAANQGTLKKWPDANGSFYIGEYSGIPLVVGPVPGDYSPAHKFVKVFDGTSVAAPQYLIVSSTVTTTSSTSSTTSTLASTTTTLVTTSTSPPHTTSSTTQPTTISSAATTSSTSLTTSPLSSTQSTVSTMPASSSATQSTASQSSNSSTSTTSTSTRTSSPPSETASSGGGGIPEFPFQLGLSLALTVGILILYSLARSPPQTLGR